jgi:hypothetical protein
VRTSTHAAIDVISIISATETTVIITEETNDEPYATVLSLKILPIFSKNRAGFSGNAKGSEIT